MIQTRKKEKEELMMTRSKHVLILLQAVVLIFTLSSPAMAKHKYNKKPKSITQELPVRIFDGVTNDLRTGGNGADGIKDLGSNTAFAGDGPKSADQARSLPALPVLQDPFSPKWSRLSRSASQPDW